MKIRYVVAIAAVFALAPITVAPRGSGAVLVMAQACAQAEECEDLDDYICSKKDGDHEDQVCSKE